MAGILEIPPGTIFGGDFRVVRRIAEGGMGAVYLAEQLSTERQRALKLMRRDLVGRADFRAKFEREARVGAKIASQHVVEIVAAGVDDDVPWIAMEYLEGQDLAAFMRQKGALSFHDALFLMQQICHAVGAAHAAGVVHRDLKPENVFLCDTRQVGVPFSVKVLDFGIAKVVERAAAASTTTAIGSPAWMAPEQTERTGKITPGTDVWALGLITFHLLVGKSFWLAGNDHEASMTNLLREVIVDPIPKASARALAVQPEHAALPAAFDAWCARCVTREPAARFKDAGEAYFELSGLDAPAGSRPSFTTGPVAGSLPGLPPTKPSPGNVTSDLASARTIEAPVPVLKEEIDEHLPTPVHRTPIAYVALPVALAAAALGGVVAWQRWRGPDVIVIPDDAGLVVAPPRANCPQGMRGIPAGRLMMGRDEGKPPERPAHPVTLNAYCIDQNEVTVEAYDACVKQGACRKPEPRIAWPKASVDEHRRWDPMCNSGQKDRARHPQNCVSWEEAAQFCRWAQKRLPSEEEWELAARGMDSRPFPWGANAPAPRLLNACDEGCVSAPELKDLSLVPIAIGRDGAMTTTQVGSYFDGASMFGVLDLAGNVAEWTADAHCPYPGKNCSATARTVRGGSFLSTDPDDVRTTARVGQEPDVRAADLGFRCAR